MPTEKKKKVVNKKEGRDERSIDHVRLSPLCECVPSAAALFTLFFCLSAVSPSISSFLFLLLKHLLEIIASIYYILVLRSSSSFHVFFVFQTYLFECLNDDSD
jgi:hypothetical protein